MYLCGGGGGVYSSIKQREPIFIWPEMNEKSLRFDKINWCCFIALIAPKRRSLSGVTGEDVSFLFVLVKAYEQHRDALQNIL